MHHYVTADLHLGHFNIIRYTGRPFESLDEMNDTIIRAWNNIVAPDDVVYLLGDITLKNKNNAIELIPLLNGKIILVRGNHDIGTDRLLGVDNIVSVHDRIEMGCNEKDVILVHDPVDAPADAITLCGHVHEKWAFKYPGQFVGHHPNEKRKIKPILRKAMMMNVGIDADYRPWELRGPMPLHLAMSIVVRLQEDWDAWQERYVCNWIQSDEEGVFDTDCGNRFAFFISGHEFTHCPYCGKRLVMSFPESIL